MVLVKVTIIGFLFYSHLSFAQTEEERLKGFRKHQKDFARFQTERESALEFYKKEKLKEEERRQKDFESFRKIKRMAPQDMLEGGTLWSVDQKEKGQFTEDLENARILFLKERALDLKRKGDLRISTEEELDIVEVGHRVDIKKRALFNEKTVLGKSEGISKYGSSSSSGSGTGSGAGAAGTGAGSGSGAGAGAGAGSYTPPPPPKPYSKPNDYFDNIPAPPPPVSPGDMPEMDDLDEDDL